METVTDFIFLGSKITADGDCSHEIKRPLFLGRKAMTNLESIKSRDIILSTKVHLVKAMVFPVVMYGCESAHKESWVLKNWCFWTVVLKKTLESPLDCKEIKPVSPEGNQSWLLIGRTNAEAEAPILWPPDVKNWLIGKDSDAGNDWWEGDDRGWDGWMASLTRQTWVWASSGRWWTMGSLACCSRWGRKESDTTERLNWPNWLTDSQSTLNDPKSYYPPLPEKVTEVQNGFFFNCPNPIA